MPITISAPNQAMLDGGVTTIAYCWHITRTDSVEYFYTSHDADIVVDGDTYKSGQSFSPGDMRSSTKIDRVDDFQLLGLIDVSEISVDLLRDGWFDGSEVEIFLVDFTTPTNGRIATLRRGFIGEVTIQDGQTFIAEVSGLSQKLHVASGQLYSIHCRADLGDSSCSVGLVQTAWAATTAYAVRLSGDSRVGDIVAPSVESEFWFKCITAGTSDASEPTWPVVLGGTVTDGTVEWEAIAALSRTGTITSVVSNQEFADTSRGEVDDHWNTGHIEWLTGNNTGLKKEIVDFANATGTINIFEPMRGVVQVGDTYRIHRGCPKSADACKTIFDNIYNFRGENFIPLDDAVSLTDEAN